MLLSCDTRASFVSNAETHAIGTASTSNAHGDFRGVYDEIVISRPWAVQALAQQTCHLRAAFRHSPRRRR
eukprot:1562630-Pleurochrysis_carterae.AAC.1